MKADNFYHNLPTQKGSLKTILANSAGFVDLPSDWQIIVSDIQGSTKATLEGRGRDINTLAASCVIACINVAKAHGVEIAFLYGGDGATMLVPNEYCAEMVAALKALRANAHKTYGLRLRVGSLPVSEVYKAGEKLTVAKWGVAPGYQQAIFLGNGLAFADKQIKADPATSDIPESEMPQPVNLQGLLCRWNQIDPTLPKEEVVCVIVEARNEKQQAQTYIQALETIDDIYGEYRDRHPVQAQGLSPSLNPKNFSRKDRLASGSTHIFTVLNEAVRAFVHALVFKFHVGPYDTRTYIKEMIAATDTLHVSGGTMFTIISGTAEQRQKLRQTLDKLEADGYILYGLASCPSSVVTCYVERFHEGHHHFLDGAGGGYTLAAKEWKAKRLYEKTYL